VVHAALAASVGAAVGSDGASADADGEAFSEEPTAGGALSPSSCSGWGERENEKVRTAASTPVKTTAATLQVKGT
jgi:hypothetical protein